MRGERLTSAVIPAAGLQHETQNNAAIEGVSEISVDSPISRHVERVFETIYCHPYKHSSGALMPREIHGITHVARVAFYILVLANLYKFYGDIDAQTLSSRDVQLLQIAALFHDSARQDEGIDYWDEDSATLLYSYFINTVGINSEIAIHIAEATANKDDDGVKPYRKMALINNEIVWQDAANPQNKSIYSRLIHDADCLDIIRARPRFDATYLDFYKQFARHNSEAFKAMSMLIAEVRGLIEDHGDSYCALNRSRKQKYNIREVYSLMTAEIFDSRDKPLLSSLGQQIKNNFFISFDEISSESPESSINKRLTRALREGRIFLRGIIIPSAVGGKNKEILAELELRKLFREPGISTRTQKNNRDTKFGNPVRSLTMAGPGCIIQHRQAGYVCINLPLMQINQVYQGDGCTGIGKKIKKIEDMTLEQIQQALEIVHLQQQMGGVNQAIIEQLSFGELTANLKKYDAVYFTKDMRVYDHLQSPDHNNAPCELYHYIG